MFSSSTAQRPTACPNAAVSPPTVLCCSKDGFHRPSSPAPHERETHGRRAPEVSAEVPCSRRSPGRSEADQVAGGLAGACPARKDRSEARHDTGFGNGAASGSSYPDVSRCQSGTYNPRSVASSVQQNTVRISGTSRSIEDVLRRLHADSRAATLSLRPRAGKPFRSLHNLTYSLVLKLLTTFSHLQLLGTCFMDERANLSFCSRVHFTGEPRLPGTRLDALNAVLGTRARGW